jgi:hypothetical protein
MIHFERCRQQHGAIDPYGSEGELRERLVGRWSWCNTEHGSPSSRRNDSKRAERKWFDGEGIEFDAAGNYYVLESNWDRLLRAPGLKGGGRYTIKSRPGAPDAIGSLYVELRSHDELTDAPRVYFESGPRRMKAGDQWYLFESSEP